MASLPPAIGDSKAIGATLNILGGKWKILILFALSEGVKRFNELRRLVPGVTQRMLTAQLRELEEQHIVKRTIFAQIPPKVEYELSDIGKTLTPVLCALKKWGACYLEKVAALQDAD
nr:HxlR-like helix-turn-helix [uncultured bacterium]